MGEIISSNEDHNSMTSRFTDHHNALDGSFTRSASTAAVRKRRIIESALACAADSSYWDSTSTRTQLLSVSLCDNNNNEDTLFGSHNSKRGKAENAAGKRVTFSNDLDVVACTPYEKGRTDAETIELYRNDIWYTVCLHCAPFVFVARRCMCEGK